MGVREGGRGGGEVETEMVGSLGYAAGLAGGPRNLNHPFLSADSDSDRRTVTVLRRVTQQPARVRMLEIVPTRFSNLTSEVQATVTTGTGTTSPTRTVRPRPGDGPAGPGVITLAL